MKQFKFKPGTKVKHEGMVGAGEVLEQIDGTLTAVQWYTKERGFFTSLFLTKKLYKVEE